MQINSVPNKRKGNHIDLLKILSLPSILCLPACFPNQRGPDHNLIHGFSRIPLLYECRKRFTASVGDLKKASDTVDHEILAQKFAHYHIRNSELVSSKSYLYGNPSLQELIEQTPKFQM